MGLWTTLINIARPGQDRDHCAMVTTAELWSKHGHTQHNRIAEATAVAVSLHQPLFCSTRLLGAHTLTHKLVKKEHSKNKAGKRTKLWIQSSGRSYLFLPHIFSLEFNILELNLDHNFASNYSEAQIICIHLLYDLQCKKYIFFLSLTLSIKYTMIFTYGTIELFISTDYHDF